VIKFTISYPLKLLGQVVIYHSSKHKLQHMLEVTQALLFHMSVPKPYWSDAILIACYLINRMPSTVLEDQIPDKVLPPEKPLFHLLP